MQLRQLQVFVKTASDLVHKNARPFTCKYFERPGKVSPDIFETRKTFSQGDRKYFNEVKRTYVYYLLCGHF